MDIDMTQIICVFILAGGFCLSLWLIDRVFKDD